MPDVAANNRPPTVLLVAGERGGPWRRALEAAGYGVRCPGWLDTVPAARVERPDLVVLSADLPPNALGVLMTGFRTAADLARVPVAIAGMSEAEASVHRDQRFPADRYVPAPAAPEALAREVGEAIRASRKRLQRSPAQVAILAAFGLGAVALGVRGAWGGTAALSPRAPRLPHGLDAALAAFGLGLLGVALAIAAVEAVRRPPTLAQRRTALVWAALVSLQVPNLVGARPLLMLAGFSLACLGGAEWARLGLRLHPPATPGWRRWYRSLAVSFLAVAAAPWVVLATIRGS